MSEAEQTGVDRPDDHAPEGQLRPDEPTWKVLRGYAGRRVGRLQGAYLNEAPAARADLARLRRVDPADQHSAVLAWETMFVDPPEALIGSGDTVTPAEQALVTTLHLYALHQQSKGEPMHVSGVGLGTAIRRFENPVDEKNREHPVMRRYHALTTATHPNEVLQHLRALVKQMRGRGIPLDYAQLALDLWFLSFERTRARVRLSWARDLTRPAQKAEETAADTPKIET